MRNSIHIGELIRDRLKDEGRSVLWLAKKLNCDRTNVYKIFRKSNIDVIQLLRICIVLNFDFFACYSDIYRDCTEPTDRKP
jgi:DNA invertase Pin-like site-specific DNA recombinase